MSTPRRHASVASSKATVATRSKIPIPISQSTRRTRTAAASSTAPVKTATASSTAAVRIAAASSKASGAVTRSAKSKPVATVTRRARSLQGPAPKPSETHSNFCWREGMTKKAKKTSILPSHAKSKASLNDSEAIRKEILANAKKSSIFLEPIPGGVGFRKPPKLFLGGTFFPTTGATPKHVCPLDTSIACGYGCRNKQRLSSEHRSFDAAAGAVEKRSLVNVPDKRIQVPPMTRRRSS